MSSSLEPTPEQFTALAARPTDAPVVMVNLLKFKIPGGLDRYLQYGRELRRISSVSAPASSTRDGRQRSSSVRANGLGGTRFSSSSIRRLKHSSIW